MVPLKKDFFTNITIEILSDFRNINPLFSGNYQVLVRFKLNFLKDKR